MLDPTGPPPEEFWRDREVHWRACDGNASVASPPLSWGPWWSTWSPPQRIRTMDLVIVHIDLVRMRGRFCSPAPLPNDLLPQTVRGNGRALESSAPTLPADREHGSRGRLRGTTPLTPWSLTRLGLTRRGRPLRPWRPGVFFLHEDRLLQVRRNL